MAEIGDVTRFPHRSSLIAYTGIDPDVDQSGKHDASSVPTSKRGSPHLRKTLFQIVSTYLKCSPADEPVYQFLDKKRSEGKLYYVYMTAAANKFSSRRKNPRTRPFDSSHSDFYICLLKASFSPAFVVVCFLVTTSLNVFLRFLL